MLLGDDPAQPYDPRPVLVRGGVVSEATRGRATLILAGLVVLAVVVPTVVAVALSR